jgi:hypothetical protein
MLEQTVLAILDGLGASALSRRARR